MKTKLTTATVSPYEEDGLITHILLYNSVPVISSLFLPEHCPSAGLWPLRGIKLFGNYSTNCCCWIQLGKARTGQGLLQFSEYERSVRIKASVHWTLKCVLDTFHVVSASYCFPLLHPTDSSERAVLPTPPSQHPTNTTNYVLHNPHASPLLPIYKVRAIRCI